MATKTPIDKLTAAINSALKDYASGIETEVSAAAVRVAKAGAKALKAESKKLFGNGRYARGWTAATNKGKRKTTGIVYNKDVPGLAHLLEHGHALRGGGRTKANPHIAPVEVKIVEEFEKEVESLI